MAGVLREVVENDIPIFFEQQNDPEAIEMAAFPPREWEAFAAHWARIRADDSCVLKTIVFEGEVAGNIGCWPRDDKRYVGYWLGREFWGHGLATAALAAFLPLVDERPLRATVAPANKASVRVLEKNGFRLLREEPEVLTFELS